MNKKELAKAFEEKLISEEKYKQELFALETAPKQPRKAKRIYESLNEEEFIKLLKATKMEHHRLAFILAYGSGLRIGEILALKPEDVNLKEHKIFIRQAKGSKDRIVNTPKWLKEKHLKLMPLGK